MWYFHMCWGAEEVRDQRHPLLARASDEGLNSTCWTNRVWATPPPPPTPAPSLPIPIPTTFLAQGPHNHLPREPWKVQSLGLSAGGGQGGNRGKPAPTRHIPGLPGAVLPSAALVLAEVWGHSPNSLINLPGAVLFVGTTAVYIWSMQLSIRLVLMFQEYVCFIKIKHIVKC